MLILSHEKQVLVVGVSKLVKRKEVGTKVLNKTCQVSVNHLLAKYLSFSCVLCSAQLAVFLILVSFVLSPCVFML